MALISSKLIITSLSLFHLTLAYFFLASPKTINDQALVFVLGESMGMPEAQGFDSPSPQLALLSAVLAVLALTDLISLSSLPDGFAEIYHWGAQAPLRFLFSMLLAFYSYAFGPSSILFGSSPPRSTTAGGSSFALSPSIGDGLKNRVLFTLMFVEMVGWFWAWITLREERGALLDRMQKQHAHEHTD